MAERESVRFTRREHQILELIALGYTDKEVATQLRISRDTVATHMRRLFTRLGIHRRSAAVAALLDGRVARSTAP